MTTAATISARLTLNKKEFDKGVAGAKKGGTSLKKNLGGVLGKVTKVAGAIGVAGVALKQMYDVARGGAVLLTLDDRFDRLATTIGATGNVLKTQLLDTMGGLVSEAEAVSAAVDFMSLGLVKSQEDVIRLAAASAQLGFDMNQLVLTLTNQTTMRFDALGVSVDGFKENLGDLKATGMDVNDAFTEAFLQQAEAQIEKVGSIAETAEGKFLRVEAVVKDFKDNFTKDMAVIAAGAIDAFELLFGAQDRLNNMFADTRVRIRETSTTVEEYNDRILTAYGVVNKLSDAELKNYRAILATQGATSGLGREVGALTEDQFDNMQIMEMMSTTVLPEMSEGMMELTDQTNEAASAAGGLSGTMQDVLDISNQNAGDIFLDMAKGIKFAKAGGAELNKLLNFMEENAVNIDASFADAFVGISENAFAVSQVIESEMGNISLEQAARNIRDELGIPLSEASTLVQQIVGGIITLDGLTAQAEIIITASGSGAALALSGGLASASGVFNTTADPGGLGYAHGGSFTVGGAGGADSQRVGFNATPGERVTITPPQKEGSEDISGVTNNFYGEVTVMDGSETADMMGLRVN